MRASRRPAARARRRRGPVESVAAIVLGFESIIVFLGGLVVFGLHALAPVPALAGGVGIALAMMIDTAFVRHRAGIALGWALQAVVIASGLLVPAMAIVGVLFTALWAYAIIAASRLERRVAPDPTAAGAAPPGPPEPPEPTERASR